MPCEQILICLLDMRVAPGCLCEAELELTLGVTGAVVSHSSTGISSLGRGETRVQDGYPLLSCSAESRGEVLKLGGRTSIALKE